jgi:hypothetical protein
MLLIVGFWGCAGTSGSSKTLPSSAFFASNQEEREALQTLSRSQELRMGSCQKSLSCEDATYARGLFALFENRADAINIFQELRTTMPNGRYAASSTRWLFLLQDSQPVSAHQSALFTQLRQEILHSLLDQDNLVANRRLREQERRIAELSR